MSIKWPAASNARFYNLVVVHGQERIDLWADKNNAVLTLAQGASKPRAQQVRYAWFVYPARIVAGTSTVQYGSIIATGAFRAPKGSVPRHLTAPEPAGQ